MAVSDQENRMSSTPKKDATLEFDAKVYRLSAIKKAAYKFGDRFHVDIRINSDNVIFCEVHPKAGVTITGELLGEFRNEVLDQDLREMVAEETNPIRRLLLAQVFSATSLIDDFGDEADYKQDPLGIRQPRLTADQS